MKRKKSKDLGQHFLKDKSVLRKIIRTISPQREDLILEIGAGKGALTLPLAEKAGMVIALEKDKTLIPGLKAKQFPKLSVLEGDVLKIRFADLLPQREGFCQNIKLVGNLPYVISSQILLKALEERDLFSDCVFLLQKEVAERISAQPGTKAYAPLSMRLQNHFDITICFAVGPESFYPPPKVMSTLVHLKKRPQPLFSLSDEAAFARFLKMAFRHRRKTLANNLVMAGHDRTQLTQIFQTLGLEKTIRPEQLTLSQFVELFHSQNKKGIVNGQS